MNRRTFTKLLPAIALLPFFKPKKEELPDSVVIWEPEYGDITGCGHFDSEFERWMHEGDIKMVIDEHEFNEIICMMGKPDA